MVPSTLYPRQKDRLVIVYILYLGTHHMNKQTYRNYKDHININATFEGNRSKLALKVIISDTT